MKGINPMGLSSHCGDYKNKNNFSRTWKCNKQPYYLTQINCKGLTQWFFVHLGPTIKQKIVHKHKNKTNNLKI